jgi:hypothetical protein
MENPEYKVDVSKYFLFSSKRGLAFGVIAGFIATWSISTAIAASEIELGLPISTFYAILASSLGAGNLAAAAYLGFGLHLVTGTILGGIIGVLAVRIERSRKSGMENLLNPYRATAMGIGTGILVWAVLFLPVTLFFVQPSEGQIAGLLATYGGDHSTAVGNLPDLGQSFRGIAISAILFHMVWGAIFGFIINSLSRIRIASARERNADPSAYRFTSRSIKVALFGLGAGIIAALAISSLLLLAEKVSSLPIGTFYYILVSGITGSFSSNVPGAVALGLGIHLAAGGIIGLIMSAPFVVNMMRLGGAASAKKSFFQKHGPVYGLAFGFGIWTLLFMPFTYLAVIPMLNSFENQDIYLGQRVPTGELTSTTFFKVTSMVDQIIYAAIVFNMFYGLLVGIMCQSFFERYRKTPPKSEVSQMASGAVGNDST